MTLRIDIRDRRLRGGRITLDARTDRKVERNRRESMIRDLMEQGETAIIEGLRTRQLDIADVQRAHTEKGVGRERALKDMRQRVTGTAGPTLQEGVDKVMAIVRASYRPRTATLYESISKSMLGHFTPDRLMADILTTDAEAYLTEGKETMGGATWGGGRQHGARMFGSLVWRKCIRDEEERAEKEGRAAALTRNVWRLVDVPRYQPNRVEFLRPEEWLRVRDLACGLPAAALLALGCRAGLRAEECAYLRTGVDVDLERRVILVRPRTGAWPWKPKTKRSVREVPMPDDLHAILTEHIECGYAGRTFFLHSPGYDRPISHTLIIKWTRAAFTAAGIQYGRKKDALTFHSLRHTFASWLTQAGMHPKKVARLIGDTPEMVLRVYGHLAEDDFIEAVGLLNAAVDEKIRSSSVGTSGDDFAETLQHVVTV